MKKNVLTIFILGGLISFLSACGGGGGSGGSGSRSGVRLLNGAIDAPPLGLFSDQDLAAARSSAKFAQDSLRVGLDEGPQNLIISKGADAARSLFSVPVTFAKGSAISLLVHGDRGDLGLRSSLISDDFGEAPEGSVPFRIVHALNGAADLNFTISGGGQSLSGSAAFGQASSYVFLPVGVYTLEVKRASDGRSLFSAAKSLEKGQAHTVLVTGEVDYLVVGPSYLN